MKNNSINSVPGYSSAIHLTGARYVRVSYDSGALPSGTTTLYTVPAGKRAFVSLCQVFNTNVGSPSITFTPQITIDGTAYNFKATGAVAVQVQNAFPIDYFAEAGEVISITTDAAGLNIHFKVLEFDANVPIYSSKITTTVTGDNTLYTVPTGKTAILLGYQAQQPAYFNAISGVNMSGTLTTYNFYIVPFGETRGSQHQIAQAASIAINTISLNRRPSVASLNAGDAVIITADVGAANQLLWTNVLEV